MLASASAFALDHRIAGSIAHAQLAGSISIAHCLDTIATNLARDEARCPAFLIQPLKSAQQTCAEVGGQLQATPTADVWMLDVNGDAVQEYTFEYEGIVSCEGAWSVFSCGSRGCPKGLYQKHDGAWRVIGQVWGTSGPETLEMLDAAANQMNRDLRVGCTGDDRCNEFWYYQWIGAQYDRTHLEVRGHRVEFAESIHGLYGVVGEIDLLATPTASAAVIGHYGAATEIEIVGTAAGADYYYVSPCNACESGFVPKAAVRALQR